MKRLICALSLVALSTALQAAAPIAKIQAMLARPDVLCGRFDQSKQLNGMKKPLASSGRFCIAAGKGVLWRTLQPFPSTLRLTRDEIVNFQGDRVAMRLDAKQEPTVRMINSILFSLLAGDLAQLDTLFDVSGTATGAGWSVALKARDPALAKAIGAITVDGDVYVKNITISEAGGDRTAIAFSAMETGAGTMRPDEAALF
jgi:hypothetical protein